MALGGGGRDLLAPLLRRRRRKKNHKSGYSGEKRGLAAKGWLATLPPPLLLFWFQNSAAVFWSWRWLVGFQEKGEKGDLRGLFNSPLFLLPTPLFWNIPDTPFPKFLLFSSPPLLLSGNESLRTNEEKKGRNFLVQIGRERKVSLERVSPLNAICLWRKIRESTGVYIF